MKSCEVFTFGSLLLEDDLFELVIIVKWALRLRGEASVLAGSF